MNREGQNQPAKPVRLRWYAETIREARQALRCGRVDRDTLAMAHLPVGIDVVRRMAANLGRTEEIPDWVQEAALVILEAAEYYLQDRPNVPFAAYAAGAVYRHLRRVWRRSLPVRVPAHLSGTVLKFNRLVNQALQEDRRPTDAELAEALGIPEARVRELWRVRELLEVDMPSLDDSLFDSGGEALTLGDTIAGSENVEEEALGALERREREEELRRAVQQLPDLYRLAVALTTGYRTVETTRVGDVLDVQMSMKRQNRARVKLQQVFREGEADARKLGFEPEDARGVPRGCRPFFADVAHVGAGAKRRQHSAEDIWRLLASRFGPAAEVDAHEHLGA